MAVGIGVGVGVALAETANIQRRADFGTYRPALPSLLLDRRGKLITEFFAEERREIVSIHELPTHLMQAVIAKEDRNFFSHHGFSVKGIVRAAWNILAGHYFSGGSTISQQVAGNLYEDRSVTTLGRKLAELWWSLQLEKKRSKIEILEIYLNNSKFGHGNYGVESASRFYFGHSASELSLAEATLLTVHLSNPVTRSMINYPNRARSLQASLLTDMAELGYIDPETASLEFERFWQAYEPTKTAHTTTHTERTDRAPEFSELIRRRFEELFYGSPDLYRDGFVIHSGLDLAYQDIAERLVDETAERLGTVIETENAYRRELVEKTLLPAVELFGTVFGMDEVRVVSPAERAAEDVRHNLLAPIRLIDLVLGDGARADRLGESLQPERPVVVGELAAIDNDTGHILAFAGRRTGDDEVYLGMGEELKSLGNTVGPLVYAAAIESKAVTAGTLLYDSPAYITDQRGARLLETTSGPYHGAVPAWRAVSDGLQAPLIEIADRCPDRVVQRVLTRLLGDPFGERAYVPPIAGRVTADAQASLLHATAAFASFARDGNPVIPLAIRYIEDRNGIVVYDNELAALRESVRSEAAVSKPTAYIVRDTLSRTLSEGALARRVAEAGGMERGDYGATVGGTPDWSAAWTIGSSSHMTAAVWFGRDREGETLGQYRTGAGVAGPVWTRFMKLVHSDLPMTDPGSGATPDSVIHRRVCAVSGELPGPECNEGVVVLPFVAGTEPETLCTYHPERKHEYESMLTRLRDRFRLTPLPEVFADRLSGFGEDDTSEELPGAERDTPPEYNPYLD